MLCVFVSWFCFKLLILGSLPAAAWNKITTQNKMKRILPRFSLLQGIAERRKPYPQTCNLWELSYWISSLEHATWILSQPNGPWFCRALINPYCSPLESERSRASYTIFSWAQFIVIHLNMVTNWAQHESRSSSFPKNTFLSTMGYCFIYNSINWVWQSVLPMHTLWCNGKSYYS